MIIAVCAEQGISSQRIAESLNLSFSFLHLSVARAAEVQPKPRSKERLEFFNLKNLCIKRESKEKVVIAGNKTVNKNTGVMVKNPKSPNKIYVANSFIFLYFLSYL